MNFHKKEGKNMLETKTAELEVIHIKQNDMDMFVGAAPAKHLIYITTVDYYNPSLSPTDKKQGYQRPPEKSRITKIGRFLTDSENHILFPTAVLLSARNDLEYDKKRGTITISYDSPLQIIDGQHRIAGLKYAIQEKQAKHLENFPIPFVIIKCNDKTVEMKQFMIVNGTAKSVRTDLVNMILTNLYADASKNEIPEKERWKIVISNVVDKLSKDTNSPWYGMIILPGESVKKGDKKIIPATSFITSLKPVYMWLKIAILDDKTRSVDEEIEVVYKILINYWNAIKEVVPEPFNSPDKYVIQKTPGIFSLHKLLKHLLNNLYKGRREFDKDTFVEFLQQSPEITDPGFWSVQDGRASVYGSMKGFEQLYEIIREPYI